MANMEAVNVVNGAGELLAPFDTLVDGGHASGLIVFTQVTMLGTLKNDSVLDDLEAFDHMGVLANTHHVLEDELFTFDVFLGIRVMRADLVDLTANSRRGVDQSGPPRGNELGAFRGVNVACWRHIIIIVPKEAHLDAFTCLVLRSRWLDRRERYLVREGSKEENNKINPLFLLKVSIAFILLCVQGLCLSRGI